MRWNMLGALGCLSVVTAAFGAKWYSLDNGSAVPLPGDGQISVGTVNGTVLLRVWSDQPTTEDVQALTISGSAGSSPQLQILVTGLGVPAFPDDPRQEVTSTGANNLAGLSFSDTTLRDTSRLVVAINGQITGPIDCGQAFRIQPRMGTSATGDITTHAPDNSEGFKACEVITRPWATSRATSPCPPAASAASPL